MLIYFFFIKLLYSIPCSSVEAERLFSQVSLIINKLRTSLSPEKLEMCPFLKQNLEKILIQIYYVQLEKEMDQEIHEFYR